MKELTIIEKAQRYNEAIERANAAHKDEDRHLKAALERIFPELKESEDKRIMKGIIKYLEQSHFGEEPYSIDDDIVRDYITWLEKQDELIGDTDTVDSNEDGLIAETISSKSTDKVKPKFHEGDWITIDKPCQVISIDDNENYIVQYCDDEKTSVISKKFCEFYFHFWTIQDAKDGDVLIDKSGNRECPFIFKETKPSDIKTDILNPLAVLGYCGIGGAGFTKGSGWGDTANCIYYPATKEQRDQLEKAMADAGYIWDSKSKRLLSLKAGLNYTQNPAWSEEDEKMLNQIIKDYERANESWLKGQGSLPFGNRIKWLKSLKDRVLPNPAEWSKEDEAGLSDALWCCKQAASIAKNENDMGNVWYAETWLKSLRPQSTWKPSNEQISALEWQLSNTSDSSWQYKAIKEIYEHLKQL